MSEEHKVHQRRSHPDAPKRVMSVPLVEHRDGYIYGKYEPGNGTSYKALAFPIKDYVDCGWMGSINGGWLIVSGLANCRGYLLPKNPYLSVGWIADHFDLVGEDARYFTRLLQKMLEAPG